MFTGLSCIRTEIELEHCGFVEGTGTSNVIFIRGKFINGSKNIVRFWKSLKYQDSQKYVAG